LDQHDIVSHVSVAPRKKDQQFIYTQLSHIGTHGIAVICTKQHRDAPGN